MPNTTVSNKSVAIIVGFTEGAWHRRRMQRALEKRGYHVVEDPLKADIVFAHSGGCFSVPLNLKPEQIVMLVDPTYWPGKPIRKRGQLMTLQMLQSLKPSRELSYYAWKTLHNTAYLFWHAGQNMAIVRHVKKYNLAEELRHKRTILVRNQNDPWLTPDFHDLRQKHKFLQTIDLPGDHDDCWLHPDRYIDLLELELKEH